MIQSQFDSNSGDKSKKPRELRANGKRLLSRSRVLRYDPASSEHRAKEHRKPDGNRAWGDADMEVTGAGSVGRTGGIRPLQSANAAEVSAASATNINAPQDEILISDAARSLSELQMDPQVRAARLAEIKSAIESGSYDSPQRLEAAIDKMIVAWNRGG